jgi:hypothetical protein
MKEEMNSLVNKQTWELVQMPARKRALQNKWVYKLKEEDGGKKMVEVLHLEQLDVKNNFSPWGFGGRDLYAATTGV